MNTVLIVLVVLLIIIILIFIITSLYHKKTDKKDFMVDVQIEQTEQISYHNGDVLEAICANPPKDETRILLHICNNKGGWGAGFVLALSKKWQEPEKQYRKCFRDKINFELGEIQPIKIKENLYVVNMVAQNGYKTAKNPTPLDYNALDKCLNTVMVWIDENNFQFPIIYCPKIGTGLSGGDWNIIKDVLHGQLNEIPIKVYEL